MQSNSIHSNKDDKVKNILFAFLPLLIAMLLQYVVNVGDVIIIFLRNLASDERSGSANTVESIMKQAYNQPMNMAYMAAAQYIIYGLVFGIWYYRSFCKIYISDSSGGNNEQGSISIMSRIKAPLLKLVRSGAMIFIIAAGYSGQVLVDSILALIRPVFASAFIEYDKLVSNVVGVTSSGVMLLSVLVLAPIAEELLFRGLILGYFKKSMHILPAILLQGLLFGLYHGNMIQGVYAFVLGSVLGLLAYRLDSIIPSVIFHMAINISILLVPNAWFESTASCVTAIICSIIVFTGMLILTLRRKTAKKD